MRPMESRAHRSCSLAGSDLRGDLALVRRLVSKHRRTDDVADREDVRDWAHLRSTG